MPENGIWSQDVDILKLYEEGFEATVTDPEADRQLFGSTQPFFVEFPFAESRGKGKLSLPFKYAIALDQQFGEYERQQTGSCVAHGTRNAGTIDYSADAVWGETVYKGRLCFENIYGWRGHGGQGASCSRLATYVSQNGPGGFLYRTKYTSEDGRYTIDLSKQDSKTAHNWGRSGTPSWLNKIASRNKALRVYDCTSLEEARDALALGYGLNMCSRLGFSSSRNDDGLSEQRGSWAHAMAWVACNDTEWAYKKYGGPLFLVQNSWGRWNNGPRTHEQPHGSFWIRPEVAKRMIDGRGGWIIASVRGYEKERILDRHSDMQRL